MTTPPYDASSTDGWMRRFACSARATEEQLTALDQEVGDGDFGTNLTAGVGAAVRRLDRLPADGFGPAAPLEAAATAFLDEVGGTSGPLFGLLLQSLAAAVDSGGPTTTALAEGAADGLAAIQRVGDAALGDKTLVDALAPAAEALRATPPGEPPQVALAAAAQAAWRGVRETARLRARMGRSSYVGERAAGVPDPGAVGVGLLFASDAGVVEELAPHIG
ncbi:dihydroxyacetone kinase subunit DhaL [Streptomyces tsukubensis]|uniref:Dihydroxyacetone kinase subunit L n=2 Tax=Streptomyces TaxID=1883 RepID=A0A1V4A0M0_9ACTN|nr:dihydroxyacetone kinase subunit DhaL [Streptomyces tsukubensis]OON72039.1 dihydroxyacetone kinase subunit L [Streptomyces tsukubensis]QFR93257.1 dihydroxyacetone kinase subunit L [Streptomyces tsukubensis]CBY83969.1 putative dihydroxyacetone kinase (subunit 2) [Streptomyces tacrolimicus]